jgi:DNA-binding PadR family transcriptional regulator
MQQAEVAFQTSTIASYAIIVRATHYSAIQWSMPKPRSSAVDHFLPLTPPMLHTLVALADGDKHGYAILKEIARRTNGSVRLSAGTLYALIKRATADALIVECDERPDPALDDERRRYYRLTPLGRKVAAAEIARLESIVEMARAKDLVRRPSEG